MIAVTTTDLQNNFGKYLQAVQLGDEIIVLKNGAEVAHLQGAQCLLSDGCPHRRAERGL